jgi:hypothetical protein
MNRDKEILARLRKGYLAMLGDEEYKMIEDEVDKKGFKGLTGYAKSIINKAVYEMKDEMYKAKKVREGDMVSWNSSGGTARGKVIHVMDYGTLDVPNTDFKIKGEKDDPAVLIQLYRDGEPTDTQVGHKASTLKKKLVTKHGNHDQRSHGSWSDESDGEYLDTEGLHGSHRRRKDDSEGEFEDDDDDMEAMDMMDILRPPRR